MRAGRPLNWAWHLRRLAADGALLRLALPEPGLLLDEVRAVAPGDATVKIIVTRGAAGRGYAIACAGRPTRVVAAFPAVPDDPGRARDGVRVRRCALVLSEQPRLAGA
ncbi:MAG TPA: aminodeoxychorismate lyase, partial [Myxococcota bacterium]|nr:aminodeoxychorismate lyase [Myxococcota bacterium]